MSISKCALSGKLVQFPVISKITGDIYEKDIIENHIEKTGQCPITGKEMTLDDIIEIKATNSDIVPTKVIDHVPDTLDRIKLEYEALIFEKFNLKKQLDEVKRELGDTVYQHEAASMVICRLIKERDEAVSILNNFRAQFGELIQDEEQRNEGEEFDYMGIYKDLVDRMIDMSSILIEGRKKRVVPKEMKSEEDFAKFTVKMSLPLHSASKPGITCLDIHPFHDNLLISGGNDARAVIFDRESQKTLFTLDNAHTKRINSVLFYPSPDISGFIAGSVDNSASFWIQEDKNSNDDTSFAFSERLRIVNHSGPVTDLSFHPLREYCLISSRDQHWSFHNLIKGVCLEKVKSETSQEISKCQFHPDGLIFATGESNGLVHIWDIQSQKAAATFEGHSSEISALCFSDNGIHLASAGAKENNVKLWDLRKPGAFKTIELPANYVVRSVCYDSSGSYLAIGGNSIILAGAKSMKVVAEFKDHEDLVTCVKFGKLCEYIASTSLDRNLKIFS